MESFSSPLCGREDRGLRGEQLRDACIHVLMHTDRLNHLLKKLFGHCV